MMMELDIPLIYLKKNRAFSDGVTQDFLRIFLSAANPR